MNRKMFLKYLKDVKTFHHFCAVLVFYIQLPFFKARIVLLHDDITIKTFIKILLFNAKDHGCLAGAKQRNLPKVVLKPV